MLRNFEITFEDTKLIRDFEGFSLNAYKDGGGVTTIAWGLTGPNIKMGMRITEEEAREMFMKRIEDFCVQLDSLLKVLLPKNKYLSILSITYNIGLGAFKKSTLLKLVNAEKYKEASLEFEKWNKDNGKVIAGLARRRKAEKDLFLS